MHVEFEIHIFYCLEVIDI